MEKHNLHVLITFVGSALAAVYLSRFVFDGARWWNLVMALLLLVALMAYLWQEQRRRED